MRNSKKKFGTTGNRRWNNAVERKETERRWFPHFRALDLRSRRGATGAPHLQAVPLLLKSPQAAAVRLTLDRHVRLPLQDVQAQLLAAAHALLHTHQQAGVLAGNKEGGGGHFKVVS